MKSCMVSRRPIHSVAHPPPRLQAQSLQKWRTAYEHQPFMFWRIGWHDDRMSKSISQEDLACPGSKVRHAIAIEFTRRHIGVLGGPIESQIPISPRRLIRRADVNIPCQSGRTMQLVCPTCSPAEPSPPVGARWRAGKGAGHNVVADPPTRRPMGPKTFRESAGDAPGPPPLSHAVVRTGKLLPGATLCIGYPPSHRLEVATSRL